MRILPVIQGGEDWQRARLGILTSSDFSRAITPKKWEPSSPGIKTLAREKAAEWATGDVLELPHTELMERGNRMEVEAADYYALETGLDPRTVGFCLLDDRDIGCSPDRLVGEDGLLELKCPGPKNMVAYLLDPDALVEEYRAQVQGQLWVTGREWCDLYAFNPVLPSVRVRCYPDPEYQSALRAAVLECQLVLDAMKDALRAKGVVSPLEAHEAAERVRAAEKAAAVAAFGAALDSSVDPGAARREREAAGLPTEGPSSLDDLQF